MYLIGSNDILGGLPGPTFFRIEAAYYTFIPLAVFQGTVAFITTWNTFCAMRGTQPWYTVTAIEKY